MCTKEDLPIIQEGIAKTSDALIALASELDAREDVDPRAKTAAKVIILAQVLANLKSDREKVARLMQSETELTGTEFSYGSYREDALAPRIGVLKIRVDDMVRSKVSGLYGDTTLREMASRYDEGVRTALNLA